jgi:alpha-tubulin suppressor-like RCC1 family protein
VVGLPSNVIAVSAGGGGTCALTAAGAVKCWGEWSSQGPVDMAGLTSGVIAISPGTGFMCGATTAGAVKCLGNNDFGQLGHGSTAESGQVPADVVGLPDAIAVSAGYAHACALTATDAVKCWGDNTYGQLGHGSTVDQGDVPLDVVGLSSGVIAVSAGSSHTCAITASGGVKCWGTNINGQLGNGTTTESHVPVDVVGF